MEKSYKERYQSWCESPFLDDASRKELLSIREDDKEIFDRFYCDMAFGTGGMRGLIGAGTNRINRYTVRKATLGFARYLQKTAGDTAPAAGVVIAHDNRRMSRVFALETAGVLAAEGIRAFLFSSLRTTPELSFAVRYLKAAGGVVITASHNPPEYNGYKVYDGAGCQLVPRCTDILIRLVDEIENPLEIPSLSPAQAGGLIETPGEDVDEAYYKAVMGISLCPRLNKKGMKVVYSPQHGTGNIPVREVLGRMGYEVIPVEEQCFPDEDFVNTKNPNPETPEAYELALKKAEETGAELVITTDPDCDRLGVAVKVGDTYRRMTGNQSGAVLLEYILMMRKAEGILPADAVMCNTIVTSGLGDAVARHYGVAVEKTLTGFKFIGDKMREYEEKGTPTYVFGYEESYGCLIGNFVRDKDAVQAALMLCEAAAYYRGEGKTLIDVLHDLYARHGYFLDAQTNVYHKGAEGKEKIAALLTHLRENPPAAAGGIPVVKVEDYMTDEMRRKGFPASNVLRFLLADGSFVAVRPSGTEPKCKYYYCVVGKDEKEAAEKLSALKAVFEA